MVDVKEDAGDAWWHYTINYGPDGEENYANVYAPGKDLVSNLKIHHARAIVAAMNDKLLATPEAEPGLIDEIHELAGMVGATFTPHEKPTPEAEPVAYADLGHLARKEAAGSSVYPFPTGTCRSPVYVHPATSEADVEAAVDRAAIAWCGQKERETSLDDITYFKNNWRALPGLRAYVAEALLDRTLTAFLKARRQG